MKNIERRDLVRAVLASRDAIDPPLESKLLEAIVEAEADCAGDGAAAMHAIDLAVTAAIERGSGAADPAAPIEGDADGDG